MTIFYSFAFHLIIVITQRNILAEDGLGSTCQNIEFKFVHSCAANNNEVFPLCHCDDICHFFDDCCRDAPTMHRHNLTLEDLEHLSEIHRVNDSSCTPIPGARYQYGVWMIERCNNLSCSGDPHSLLSLTPVTDLEGLTYRNKECAECNGVEEFTSWYPKFFYLQEDNHFLDEVLPDINAVDVANNLLMKTNNGTVELVMEFDVTNSNVPRFCFAFNDQLKECPSYVSPYVRHCQNSYILSRNRLCPVEKDYRCNWEGCLEFFDPFEPPNHLRGSPMPLTIITRFVGNNDEIFQRRDASKTISLVEVQYVRVNFMMMFQTAFPLDYRELSIYTESLLVSFYYHSGYKLGLVVEHIFIFSQGVNCQLERCTNYFVVFEMSCHSILKQNELQDLLNLKFDLIYSDAITIPTNLTVKVNASDVSAFDVLEQSRMDMTTIYVNNKIYEMNDHYEFLSEMIHCFKLLITCEYGTEPMPIVDTKCLTKKANVVTNENNRINDIRQDNTGNSIGRVTDYTFFIALFGISKVFE